jgi:hypothetical protein
LHALRWIHACRSDDPPLSHPFAKAKCFPQPARDACPDLFSKV